MANPQLENGYTRIANDILDALTSIRVSGEAMQVFLLILRKTYGFGKKEDCIALSQFCLATKMKKPAVCRAIQKLYDMNLIIKKDNDLAIMYRINKDFDTWKPLSKKITIIKKDNDHYQKREKSLAKKSTTIEKKETITKENIEFNEFWSIYPKKAEKKKSEELWLKINLSLQRKILEDIPRRILGKKWKEGFIENPTTYLRGERWEDDIEEFKGVMVENREVLQITRYNNQ